MKFLHILSLLLVALVAYTSAQRCVGLRNANCAGGRNVGRGGRGCIPINVWYYDARGRQCRQQRYLGCAGNNNRYCTRAICEQRCRR